MSKIRNAEVLSLDTTKQKEVVKETKQLKKKIKDGTISVKQIKQERKLIAEQRRGLIFISHLPHGFYEEELKKYFRQFGKVTHVQVCRSGRTGNSKGYGYVEFENPDVAKIAAETMNNYLMFKKRIIAEYVPFEKRPKGLFTAKHNKPTRFSSKVRREKQYRANLNLDTETHIRRTTSRLSNLNKKLEWLEKIGVKPTYTPIDVAVIKQEGSSTETIESKNQNKETRRVVKSLPNLSISSKKSKSSILLSNKGEIVNKSSPVVAVVKNKKLKKKTQSRGITKKSKKPEPLNADTVKKIARELIRKRGNSLLTRSVETTHKLTKKKSTKK